jgi:transposase InsO family protein
VIVVYIDAYRSRFGVEPICRVLSEHGMRIAPSTYYAAQHARVSPAALADAYRTNALVDLFRANRSVYGVRKMLPAMLREGHVIGRDQVGRLMGIAGLAGAVRGKHTTITTKRAGTTSPPRHPDLIDRAWHAPTRPDQWWVADFTYVWTLGLSVLRRCCSERVLVRPNQRVRFVEQVACSGTPKQQPVATKTSEYRANRGGRVWPQDQHEDRRASG